MHLMTPVPGSGTVIAVSILARPRGRALHSLLVRLPGLAYWFQSSPAPEDGRCSRHSKSLNCLGLSQCLRDSCVTRLRSRLANFAMFQ